MFRNALILVKLKWGGISMLARPIANGAHGL